MYPARHLTRLARQKRRLRERIGRSRTACAQAATRLARPLAWVDRARDLWRRAAPFAWAAALPLALLRRRSTPRAGVFATLVRWAPLAVGLFRRFSRARAE
jgi:hypothetical protein